MLSCIYQLYKLLKSDCPWYYNIPALYYSIYITTGVFHVFISMLGSPSILICALQYYPDASDNFHSTFHDIGYNSITDNMGIIFFNHYLYQHLENQPMLFLPNLVSLPEN